jgi:hypothetical protein
MIYARTPDDLRVDALIATRQAAAAALLVIDLECLGAVTPRDLISTRRLTRYARRAQRRAARAAK